MMNDDLIVFDPAREWDFEKFTTVIFYLQAYYDAYLKDKPALTGNHDGYCRIPVSDELLTRMDIEESLDEFYGEAEVMQQEMLLDPESEPLLKVVREAAGLVLLLDPVLLDAMTVLPDTDDFGSDASAQHIWYG